MQESDNSNLNEILSNIINDDKIETIAYERDGKKFEIVVRERNLNEKEITHLKLFLKTPESEDELLNSVKSGNFIGAMCREGSVDFLFKTHPYCMAINVIFKPLNTDRFYHTYPNQNKIFDDCEGYKLYDIKIYEPNELDGVNLDEYKLPLNKMKYNILQRIDITFRLGDDIRVKTLIRKFESDEDDKFSRIEYFCYKR